MEKTTDLERRAAVRRKTPEARGNAPASSRAPQSLTRTGRLRRSLQTEVRGRKQAEAALQNSEAALLRSHEELRALTASLLHSQDDERRRVSRQLHDELSQEMAKLQFDVETLEKRLPPQGDERRQLLAIRDSVGSLANNVRRIAHQLHPSALDHLGLPAALRAFIHEFAGRENLAVRLTARKVPTQISPEIASSLYRVVQEALRNIAKHAGKTSVTIVLAGLRNQLFLSIRDRGVGFDQRLAEGNGGLGLIAMHERVHLVDGDFSLNTRPGHGVVITIRIPLQL